MTVKATSQHTQAAPVRSPIREEPPPLNPGDHLPRVEFERRYQLHPELKKAELIEGVVYVPSPTHLEKHGDPHFDIIGWLAAYRAATPGIKGSDNATGRLDFENEVQPDILLRLEPAFGGQARVGQDDFLEGPPEFIVEIAASSAAYDLHEKKRVYARSGVKEYLVVQMYEGRIDWFVLREGVYESLAPDEQGILRSELFPGLWLKEEALWAGDLATLLAVLQEGLASPDHIAFVEQLKAGKQD
jgi:Uma2 family endonuclease